MAHFKKSQLFYFEPFSHRVDASLDNGRVWFDARKELRYERLKDSGVVCRVDSVTSIRIDIFAVVTTDLE